MRRGAAAALLSAALALGCTGAGVAKRYPDAPVVLISIDTLRADRLGLYGHAAAATPAIDALGAESVVFERAYSHCPLTLPAHASLLTGLLPPRHGVRDNIGFALGDDSETLATRLAESGWRTGAAVSSYVLRHQTGIGRGFETFDDAIEVERGTAALASVQRDGAAAVEALAAWLESLGETEPFFAFLHLYEPHTPYAPPPPHDRHRHPYDGEVAYADELVGRFLQRLKAAGRYHRALLVLTADHGEGLGDHGEDEHGLFLYREAVRVPLIVKLPGGARGGTRVAQAVAHVDVPATLLDLLGLPATAGADGRTLRDALDGEPLETRPVYSETLYPRYHFGWSELYAASDGRYRYVRAPRPELYDLDSDPSEAKNLAAERGATVQELHAWLEQRIAAGEPPEPQQVDDDVRRRLEALGYLGAAAAEVPEQRADPKDKLDVFRAFGEGLRLRRAGDDAGAVAALRRVVAAEPRMLDAWEMLGLSLARENRMEESVAALVEALELAPDRAETHLSLARTYARMGRRALAMEHARIAAAGDPAKGYELLAELQMAAGDLESAADSARRSIDSDASGIMSHFVLGVAAQRAGRCEEALAAYRRADELKRLHPNAVLRDLHANSADCLARLGREREAEREFLREIDAIAHSRKARVGLAILYFSQGRDRDARVVLEGLVEATPHPTADTYWAVVETLAVVGDRSGARDWAARARRRFPDDPRFRPPA